MKRTYAVINHLDPRDTAQAAISLARFKDAKRLSRWQPLVAALQGKARAEMADMTPKVRVSVVVGWLMMRVVDV